MYSGQRFSYHDDKLQKLQQNEDRQVRAKMKRFFFFFLFVSSATMDIVNRVSPRNALYHGYTDPSEL